MTIKEAFEKLTAACSVGMKNPFFIIRNLHNAFADIADNVVEASGDKVTVTQTVIEGTEIGSVKVNDDTTKLYAPSSAIEYSTTEHKIGKWIDGSDLYEKTVDCGALPNNAAKTVAHNISDLAFVINFEGSATRDSGVQIPLPYPYIVGSTARNTVIYIDSTNINITTQENMSVYTQSYITLRYTKSAE